MPLAQVWAWNNSHPGHFLRWDGTRHTPVRWGIEFSGVYTPQGRGGAKTTQVVTDMMLRYRLPRPRFVERDPSSAATSSAPRDNRS